ncbi:hypothetical protein PAENIP36_33200 [Paenibacillus sp. P36]
MFVTYAKTAHDKIVIVAKYTLNEVQAVIEFMAYGSFSIFLQSLMCGCFDI